VSRSVFSLIPRKPAASHMGVARCISQVAAVCRRGVTLPTVTSSPAMRTAEPKPVLTEDTGLSGTWISLDGTNAADGQEVYSVGEPASAA